jgi:hypothetical protein
MNAFHDDLFNLFDQIFRYYSKLACHPCLPECDEMFRNIMYLVKHCLGDKYCKCSDKKRGVCKVCKPDPEIYPIVIIVFLSLYFGNILHRYVELYCCCCVNRGQNSCADSKTDNITVSFTDNKFSGLTLCEGTVNGTIKCVEIFNAYNNLTGFVDVSVAGTYGSSDDCKHTFTGSASGVVKNESGCVVGTIFGSVIGTFARSECHASGILCGILVELKAKDPCCVGRNPYADMQNGLLHILEILGTAGVKNMLEILGDGVGALAKRVLHTKVNKVDDCCESKCFKDHSKKYHCEPKKCGLGYNNSKFGGFLNFV